MLPHIKGQIFVNVKLEDSYLTMDDNGSKSFYNFQNLSPKKIIAFDENENTLPEVDDKRTKIRLHQTILSV